MFHFHQSLVKVKFRAVDGQFHRAAHHHVGKFRRVGFGGIHRTDGFPFSEDRHPIAEFQHFVEFMGDDDNGITGAAHFAQNGKELLGFLMGENRGRFIEDQDPRAVVQDF